MTEQFIANVQAAGFTARQSLQVYKYIQQDAKNIKRVYSSDFNDSLEAIGRMETVAKKWFGDRAADLCMFFTNSQNEVELLMKEMEL